MLKTAQQTAEARINMSPTNLVDVIVLDVNCPSVTTTITPKKATENPTILKMVNRSFKKRIERTAMNTASRLMIIADSLAEIYVNAINVKV